MHTEINKINYWAKYFKDFKSCFLIGKGNTKQNKDSFNEEVDFMGARMSFSSQGGFASSLSRYYERVLTMFSQSTLNPEFLEEEFNQQKNILFDNIKNNEKNTPSIARRVENAIAYSVSHPYGEFISNESLKNVKLADIKNFYEIYFKPNNAYLVIIGDVKVEETKKLVKIVPQNPKKELKPRANNEPTFPPAEFRLKILSCWISPAKCIKTQEDIIINIRRPIFIILSVNL